MKRVHGERFAVLSGGTHHLRTPVTKGHDQPFTVLPAGDGPAPHGRAGHHRRAAVHPQGRLRPPGPGRALALGDVVAFAMAGAYAWNISHHDFLMHPKPGFHYLGDPGRTAAWTERTCARAGPVATRRGSAR